MEEYEMMKYKRLLEESRESLRKSDSECFKAKNLEKKDMRKVHFHKEKASYHRGVAYGIAYALSQLGYVDEDDEKLKNILLQGGGKPLC